MISINEIGNKIKKNNMSKSIREYKTSRNKRIPKRMCAIKKTSNRYNKKYVMLENYKHFLDTRKTQLEKGFILGIDINIVGRSQEVLNYIDEIELKIDGEIITLN